MNETDRLNQVQDEELAAYTDALLAGRQLPEPPPLLAQVVQSMAQVARPQPVPDSLWQKVRLQVAAEWSWQRPSFVQQRSRWLRRSPQRWTWVAAAALVLIATGVAWLALPGQPPLTGTATGNAGPMVAGMVVIVVIGAAIAAWFGSHP